MTNLLGFYWQVKKYQKRYSKSTKLGNCWGNAFLFWSFYWSQEGSPVGKGFLIRSLGCDKKALPAGGSNEKSKALDSYQPGSRAIGLGIRWHLRSVFFPAEWR
jgi:hypothetical protein